MNAEARRAFSILTAAAAVLAAIAVLHILDHMRQGADLGFLAALAGPFQLTSALGILLVTALRSRWAPPWAVLFGFFGPLGLIASHVVPDWWSAISFSYPEEGVDAASWALLAANGAADLVVGLAGVRAMRALRLPARATLT
jgi:hypothetical protein